MSLYNLLFGKNPSTEIILALIGLKENDVQRFRDCGIDFENKQIFIYTRTGGGNRWDYPNEKLTSNPYYIYDEDDDFDSTYATYYFKFPPEIEEDINNLQNLSENGISGKLIKWVQKTTNREKTESDIYTETRKQHEKLLKDLQLGLHVSKAFNGHTVVPLTDYGMEQILKAAEKNDGKFYGATFGVKPYNIIVTLDNEDKIWGYEKIKLETDWKIDWNRWNYWKNKFKDKYPKAIAVMEEDIR